MAESLVVKISMDNFLIWDGRYKFFQTARWVNPYQVVSVEEVDNPFGRLEPHIFRVIYKAKSGKIYDGYCDSNPLEDQK